MRRIAFSAVVAGAVFVAAGCGGAEESTPVSSPGAPASATLAIQHVDDGCHIWSDGRRQGSQMSVRLSSGGALTVRNNDVDVHRLIQLAGPELTLGSPMMIGTGVAVVFPEPGTYRLATEVVEVEGMDEMMEVETEGPDNELRLIVEVS